MSQITVIDPLTHIATTIESNDAQQVHGADAQGVYLGVVPLGSAAIVLPGPPPDDGVLRRWAFGGTGWVSSPTVAGSKILATARVLERIAALEAKQVRPLRAIVLALAQLRAAPAADLVPLKTQDDSIAVLRAFLPQILAANTQAELDAIIAAVIAAP